MNAIVKSLSLSVCLGAAGAACAARGPAVLWQWRDGVGTSITNCANWYDAANWAEGRTPSSTESATFTAPGVRYVKLDGTVELAGAGATGASTDAGLSSANRVILVGDDGHVFRNVGSSFNGVKYDVGGFDVYSDFEFEDWSYFTSVNVAGDVRLIGKPGNVYNAFVVAWGSFQHRLDWYANAAGGTRENAMCATNLYHGSGNLYFYAPRSSVEDVTGQWRGEKGSRYLFRTGGEHVLCSGTAVTGAGVAEGSFLKRVFAADAIELSEPLADDVDGDVTFAAQTARVYQYFPLYQRAGSGNDYLSVNKYRDEDDFRMEFGDCVEAGNPARFGTVSGWKCGTIVFHYAPLYNVYAGYCHVEFADTGNAGKTPGFPLATLRGNSGWGTGVVALFTVPGGISAKIGCATNVTQTIAKDGAGTLAIGVEGTVGAGKFAAREGTLALVNRNAAVPVSLGTLAISAGATLRVEGGDFYCKGVAADSAGALEIAAGAVVHSETALPAGVQVTGTGTFLVAHASGRADDPVFKLPEARVVGTPAFWVDAASLTNATPAGELTEEDGVTYVTRWNDCRDAAAGGVHYATNVSLRPTFVTSSGRPYVRIVGGKSAAALDALVWDEPIAVRALFLVMDPSSGGGSLLGSTQRITADFLRGATSAGALLISDASPSAAVQKSLVYIDGVETNRTAKLTGCADPTLCEAHPVGGAGWADAFGMNNGKPNFASRWDLSGGCRIHECIVYTNELTYSERLAVARYLRAKWNPATAGDVLHERFDRRQRAGALAAQTGGATGVEIPAGDVVEVETLSGAGTFVKAGAGTAWISDAAAPGVSLDVRAGELHVRSCDVSAFPCTAEGTEPFLHLDASRLDTIAYVHNASENLDRISSWTDPVSGRKATPCFSVSTNHPTLNRTSGIVPTGLPLVDFGPAMGSRNDYNMDLSALNFGGSKKLQTLFGILDTSGGGSALLGGSAGRNDGNNSYVGLWRDIQSWPDFYAQPFLVPDVITFQGKKLNNSGQMGDWRYMSTAEFRLNTEIVDQTKQGFTGGFDLFSVRTVNPMRGNVIGGTHYAWSAGGCRYGELAYWERYLLQDEVAELQAYFLKKWKGVATPYYRAATVAAVSVAAGARLAVEGAQPLAAASISGGGEVVGSVALAENADFVVDASGETIPALTVTGAVTGGGTVRVDLGANKTAPEGRHLILSATALSGTWTLAAAPDRHRLYRLEQTDAGLYLIVRDHGMTLIVR